MKNRYDSFDELKKRQKEQQKELAEAEEEMRARIDAQKERLAQENKVEGMSKEEQQEMLKKLEVQLESLEMGRMAEAARQKLNLQQRLAARKAKNARTKRAKDKMEEQKKIEEKAQEEKIGSGIGGLFERRGTLVLSDNDNSLLAQRLRAWKKAKKAKDEEKLIAEIATKDVNMDENEIKILVLKLMQVEKLLKELRRKKKKQAESGQNPARKLAKVSTLGSKQGGRPSHLRPDKLSPTAADGLRRSHDTQRSSLSFQGRK